MTPSVALVHDHVVMTGGAERLLLSIARLFPGAPIYTAIYRPTTAMKEFRQLDVRPLPSSRLPFNTSNYRAGVLAYALAFERARLEGYDLVLSTSSGFAKNAGAGARARVNLCLTPPRFIWPCGPSSERAGSAEKAITAAMRPVLRRLDLAGARRVTAFGAISELVRDRVRRFYGRDAAVVYPPVDTVAFAPVPATRDGYLVVGRLVAYKGFDTVIEACNRTRRLLMVIGIGPDEARLRALAGPTITFRGRVGDVDLVAAYSSARALLVPGEEDWGLTPLEANACGCPVIAAARGGSLESVAESVSGLFYEPREATAIDDALERFESRDWDPEACRRHAIGFGEEVFAQRLLGLVDTALGSANRVPV